MAFASPSFDHPERPQRQTASAPGKNPNARQAGQQYRRAQVETASPTQLVVLLYDGAIRFCSLAVEAMEKRKTELEAMPHSALALQSAHLNRAQRALETQNTNLIKAQRILGELMGSLDRDIGGEVAANLFALYTHMLECLVHANLYDDVAQVQTVQQLLQELRDAWQEAERLVAGGVAATAAPASEPAADPTAAITGVPASGAAPTGSAAPGSVPRGARVTRLHTALVDAALPMTPRLREQSA